MNPTNVKITVTIEGHDGVCYMRSDILDLDDYTPGPRPELGADTERGNELRSVRERVGNAFGTAYLAWARARAGAP